MNRWGSFIEGILDSKFNKTVFYQAESISDLKKQIKIYEKTRSYPKSSYKGKNKISSAKRADHIRLIRKKDVLNVEVNPTWQKTVQKNSLSVLNIEDLAIVLLNVVLGNLRTKVMVIRQIWHIMVQDYYLRILLSEIRLYPH